MNFMKIKVIFNINYITKFGEVIYVVGNNEILGNWNVEKGLRLNWNNVYKYLYLF
jgi:hypothetical protein